jgi:hypothetical protein
MERVLSIRHLDSKLATSYPVTVACAELASGRSCKVFVKDFGSSRLPKTGRPRARELHVYRDLLDGSFPDAPGYLGSIWSEEDNRRWLVLEYIEAKHLKNYGFEHWVDAARMLGGLHARFAGVADALCRCPLLAKHDATFFRVRARRARESLAHFDPVFRQRLERLLAGHGNLAEQLGTLPSTLVHGSCRPHNLLVDERGPRPRIVAIDWELAACGSGLYDLGFLAEGYVSPQLDVLLEAYGDGVRKHGGNIPGPAELRLLVDGFRLHKEIKSLGDAHELAFADATVDKILSLGEDLLGITS